MTTAQMCLGHGHRNERPGHRFYCGKFGCIETFLSGTGLAREYFLLSQKEFKAEQIAVAEKAGDPYERRQTSGEPVLVRGERSNRRKRCDCFGRRHLEHKRLIRRASRTDRAACTL